MSQTFLKAKSPYLFHSSMTARKTWTAAVPCILCPHSSSEMHTLLFGTCSSRSAVSKLRLMELQFIHGWVLSSSLQAQTSQSPNAGKATVKVIRGDFQRCKGQWGAYRLELQCLNPPCESSLVFILLWLSKSDQKRGNIILKLLGMYEFNGATVGKWGRMTVEGALGPRPAKPSSLHIINSTHLSSPTPKVSSTSLLIPHTVTISQQQ